MTTSNLSHQRFKSTDWSVVNHLGGAGAELAMASLCEQYWYPLYAYARSRVGNVHQAQDLTQGFFAHALARNSLRQAAPDRGRFRTFLLTAMKNFMANEYHKQNAQKRGGGRQLLSLDFDDGDRHFDQAAIDNLSPERIFERSWTLTLLDRVTIQLRLEFDKEGSTDRFKMFQPALNSTGADMDFEAAASELGISEVAARKAASRFRQRYRELLKIEVGRTLADSSDVDDEICRMFQSLGPEVG